MARKKNTPESFLEEVFNVSPYIYVTTLQAYNIATLWLCGEPKEGLHLRNGWLANSNPASFAPSNRVREDL